MAEIPLTRHCMRLAVRPQTRPILSQRRVFAAQASTRHLSTYGHDRWAATQQKLPILDFLLPFQTTTRSSISRSRSKLSQSRVSLPRWQTVSSTATSHAAVINNPRLDEEGREMTVDITPRAANRLKEIMKTDSNPALALRVTVESGGCHGFQYLMSLTDTSAASETDDTVFEAGDGTGAKVVMDEPSLELLKGSKIDYTMELIGSQFKIVDNPLATSSCGCGTSFDIKA